MRQIISGRPPRIFAGYSEEELYNSQVAFNLLARRGGKPVLKAMVALLCSKLMTWYHRERFLDPNKATFQKILIQDAKSLPIPALLESGGSPTGACRALGEAADRMMQLVAALRDRLSPIQAAAMANAIRRTDREIDRLVYDLYGLTPEEVALVEGPGEDTHPEDRPPSQGVG